MDRINERSIKISTTTYDRILEIKKSAKLGATIKSIVDYAIKTLKIREQ